MGSSIAIEKLTFANHTECECVEKKDDMFDDENLSISTFRSGPIHQYHRTAPIAEPETEAPIPMKK
jgi:hypothetical protein